MLGLEQYIDLVFTMLESLLLFIFLSAILNSNSNVSKELIITSIILYALIVFGLNNILPFSGIRIIYFLLLSIAFNFFLYRKKIFITIIFPVFFFACVLMSELMSLTIIEITTNFKIQELLLNELWFTTLHFGISKIILIIFLLVIVYYVKRSFLLRYSKHSYAIVASSIVSILVLSMLSEIGIETSYFDISPYYLVLCILGILFINYLVPYLVYVLTNYYEKVEEYNIYKMRVDLERIHYKDIDDYTQEIKRISHDYNNNLVILSSLISENRQIEAIDFIKDINNQIPNFYNLVKSGNAVIDVVLNHKLNEAKKKEINILLEIDDEIKVNINNVELSSLLSNVLDNAIEATSKVVNRNKRIKIILVNKGGNLIFKVTNSVMSDPREIIKSRKTTKQDKNLHGNGIGIIERIVKKHCGSLIYDYKENLFTVSVLL